VRIKRSIEFYFGLVVWLLTISITYNFWRGGSEGIEIPFSPANISIAVLFFILYLLGYFVSHGLLSTRLTKKNKILGLLISSVAAVTLSAYFFFFGLLACMIMMLIIQLASLIKQPWAVLVAIVVPASLVIIDYWLGRGFEYTNIVVYGIVNTLALTTNYRAIAERKAKLESQKLVHELKATQILLSASTKRDERLRIARNLHDIMGHQLTALSLQLEVASHITEDSKQEHIENAKTIGTTLLANVRQTVSEFREEEDLKLGDALSALIEGIPGREINLNINWDESLPDERQVEVLFRCTQEALTNVVKHSNATRCDITVSNDDRNLCLVVKDNGNEQSEIIPGNGLKGMTERINKVDGHLQFNQGADGFELLVTLPINDT